MPTITRITLQMIRGGLRMISAKLHAI